MLEYLKQNLEIEIDNLCRAIKAGYNLKADAPNSDTDFWGEAIVFWEDAIRDSRMRIALLEK